MVRMRFAASATICWRRPGMHDGERDVRAHEHQHGSGHRQRRHDTSRHFQVVGPFLLVAVLASSRRRRPTHDAPDEHEDAHDVGHEELRFQGGLKVGDLVIPDRFHDVAHTTSKFFFFSFFFCSTSL